jgi:hypothetical protein
VPKDIVRGCDSGGKSPNGEDGVPEKVKATLAMPFDHQSQEMLVGLVLWCTNANYMTYMVLFDMPVTCVDMLSRTLGVVTDVMPRPGLANGMEWDSAGTSTKKTLKTSWTHG